MITRPLPDTHIDVPGRVQRLLGWASFGLAAPLLLPLILLLKPIFDKHGRPRLTASRFVLLALVTIPILFLAAVVFLPFQLLVIVLRKLSLVKPETAEDPAATRLARRLDSLEPRLQEAARARRAWASFQPQFSGEDESFPPSLSIGVVNPASSHWPALCRDLAGLAQQHLVAAGLAQPGTRISVALLRERGRWGFSFGSPVASAHFALDEMLAVVGRPTGFEDTGNPAT